MSETISAHIAREVPYREALEKTLQVLSVPEGYALQSVQSQIQNTAAIWLFRYEKSPKEHPDLGGEHFSFAVTRDGGRLLGFTWMDRSLAEGELPTKDEAKEAARVFLDRLEPGLFGALENLWIDRHDESIRAEAGQQEGNVTVSGMKYKCYARGNDDYAWVIVGKNGMPITFEQGIKWINGRVTEKWLHDSWLQAR